VDTVADNFREFLESGGWGGRLVLLLFDLRELWQAYWPFVVPLVALTVALVLRNGFFWERLPNLRDSVRQLTDPRHPRLPEAYHEALRHLKARSDILHRGLERADSLLGKLYGPDPFGPLTFDRALSIAALYPICILFGSWLLSDAGRLGHAAVLPPLSIPKKLVVMAFLIVAGLAAILGSRVLEKLDRRRKPQIETFEGVWTRSGYNAPERRWSEYFTRDFRDLFDRHRLAESANRSEPLLRTLIPVLVMISLPFLVVWADRGFLRFRELIIFTSNEYPHDVFWNVTAITLLGGALIFTIVSLVKGQLAGIHTISAFCFMVIIFILPDEHHLRYTAVISTVYVVCSVLYSEVINSRSRKLHFVVGRVPLCMGLVAVSPVTAMSLPHLSVMAAIPSDTWAAGKPVLELILFTSLVPLYNAILDYFSVAVTRTCIGAYLRGSIGWVRFWALDLGSAIVLAVLACAGTLQIIFLMRSLGWKVDAAAIAAQFTHNPWGAQTMWITLSAVANLLPTLLHLLVVSWGLLAAKFLKDGPLVDRLLEALKAGKALHPVDARVLVRYLIVDRYLALVLVSVFSICGVYASVPWLLGFFAAR
jgi:hypothetical protein